MNNNTSEFMDKQIMDLQQSSPSFSPPQNGDNEFIDLMKHHHHQHRQEDDHHKQINDTFVLEDPSENNGFSAEKKEEILPSYDFQPIRPVSGLSHSTTNLAGSASTARVLSSPDLKSSHSLSPIRNYASVDSIEPAKLSLEKDIASDTTILSEIDRVMKKHTDSLLHVLEGVSARLTQLETRNRKLESSLDDLKLSVGNNQGNTEGKLRQLENILAKVHGGVQFLKDKREIAEAQFQLGKLQLSKVDQQVQSQNPASADLAPPVASVPVQPPSSVTFPQSHPSPVPPPAAMAPPNLPHQNLPLPGHHPNQFSRTQVPSGSPRQDAYYPPPAGQTQEPLNQQYQVPSTPAQYTPSLQSQYSLPSQPPQPQPLSSHHHEDTQYVPQQNYPPNLRQPPSQLPGGSTPSQQYYGAPPHVHEQPPTKPNAMFSSGYGLQSGSSELYPYGGPPSQFNSNTSMKPQLSSSVQGGGSGYPHLPTARVLSQSLPTASSVGGASASPRSGSRVPIDDVVDRVISMGFQRDHVRAAVQKLTENGQAVDLNVVLDKLMNDGDVQQPPRGWFGR